MLQAEKTERTHQEFLKAARFLFLEQGFDNTSIADIVERAGYSTGAFYRHYKTKSDILQELWSDFVEQYIQDSIAGAKNTKTLEEAIDYLILRSEEYFSHPMFFCYYNASIKRVLNTGKEYIPNGAKDFTDMLYQLLLREYPNAEEKRLRTYASALHAVINAYSSSEILDQDFYFDEKTSREILISMASQAGY